MVKRFSEMSKKNRDSKVVRRAKLLVSSVKHFDKELDKTEKAVNAVYASFNDPKKKFSDIQIKKAILAFSKMDYTLGSFFKKSYSNLKTAVINELPCEKISSQLEDISSLRAKLAILRAQAAASLGLEEDEIEEDLVEIDEAGYVDSEVNSVGDVFSEIGEEANEANETNEANEANTEVNEANTEANTEANETNEANEANETNGANEANLGQEEEDEEEDEEEEEMDIMNEIELEDSGIDDVLNEEILTDEIGPVEDEEEEDEEMAAVASLRKKKMASSKTQSGGISEEKEVLASLMEELSM